MSLPGRLLLWASMPNYSYELWMLQKKKQRSINFHEDLMLFFARSLSGVFVTFCLHQCNRIGKPWVASKQKKGHTRNRKFQRVKELFSFSYLKHVFWELICKWFADVFKIQGPDCHIHYYKITTKNIPQILVLK